MCKHVAAVLYGIGARLDQQPELLFRLHEVDQAELIAKAGKELPLAKAGPARSKVLGSEDLSGMFGLEMAQGTGSVSAVSDAKPRPRKARADKTVTAVSARNEKLRTRRNSSRSRKPAREDASRLRPANPGTTS